MTDLKTLKDIMSPRTYDDISTELRQEAIKWIKAIQISNARFCLKCGRQVKDLERGFDCPDDHSIYNDWLRQYEYEASDHDGAIKFIKHFFNITDEELK